jgi:hypothetical protein
MACFRLSSARVGVVLALLFALGSLGALAPAVGDAGRGQDLALNARAAGLTSGERAALQIASVAATGDNQTGLLVTVRFKGDFAHAVGRGHLSDGGAALLLTLKSGPRRSVGVLTVGPGAGRVSRHILTPVVGAIRDGRNLTFFIRGTGVSKIKLITVKTFAVVPKPRLSGKAAGGPPSVPDLSDAAWKAIRSGKATDLGSVPGLSANPSCDELMSLLSVLEKARAATDQEIKRYDGILTDDRALVAADQKDVEAHPNDRAAQHRLFVDRIGLSADEGTRRELSTRSVNLLIFFYQVQALINADPGPCHQTKTNLILSESYHHPAAGSAIVFSLACVGVITSPPLPNATGMVRLRRASDDYEQEVPITLDKDGKGQANLKIDRYDTYTVTAFIDNQDGTGTFTVVPPPPYDTSGGTCPAPR